MVQCGDIEAGLDQSDIVLEGQAYMGAQEHLYLEPQSCLVRPCDGGEEFEVIVSTQGPDFSQVRT